MCIYCLLSHPSHNGSVYLQGPELTLVAHSTTDASAAQGDSADRSLKSEHQKWNEKGQQKEDSKSLSFLLRKVTLVLFNKSFELAH